ncbi:MAG: hypothetical protein AB7R00_07665 [Kofleriaceae bacterium]
MGRPPAAARLPALAKREALQAPPSTHDRFSNGAETAGRPHLVALPNAAVPVLPSAQSHEPHADVRPSLSSRWPIFVIGIAVVAIVTAVVLMVLPKKGAAAPRTINKAVHIPTPERPEPNPLPPDRGLAPKDDPNTRPPLPNITPPAPAPVLPEAPIDPDDPQADPFAMRGNANAMLSAIMQRSCARLRSCNVDNPGLAGVCDILSQSPSPPPPTCAAATRCLESIDRMSCDDISDMSSTSGLMGTAVACADAMNC